MFNFYKTIKYLQYKTSQSFPINDGLIITNFSFIFAIFFIFCIGAFLMIFSWGDKNNAMKIMSNALLITFLLFVFIIFLLTFKICYDYTAYDLYNQKVDNIDKLNESWSTKLSSIKKTTDEYINKYAVTNSDLEKEFLILQNLDSKMTNILLSPEDQNDNTIINLYKKTIEEFNNIKIIVGDAPEEDTTITDLINNIYSNITNILYSLIKKNKELVITMNNLQSFITPAYLISQLFALYKFLQNNSINQLSNKTNIELKQFINIISDTQISKSFIIGNWNLTITYDLDYAISRNLLINKLTYKNKDSIVNIYPSASNGTLIKLFNFESLNKLSLEQNVTSTGLPVFVNNCVYTNGSNYIVFNLNFDQNLCRIYKDSNYQIPDVNFKCKNCIVCFDGQDMFFLFHMDGVVFSIVFDSLVNVTLSNGIKQDKYYYSYNNFKLFLNQEDFNPILSEFNNVNLFNKITQTLLSGGSIFNNNYTLTDDLLSSNFSLIDDSYFQNNLIPLIISNPNDSISHKIYYFNSNINVNAFIKKISIGNYTYYSLVMWNHSEVINFIPKYYTCIYVFKIDNTTKTYNVLYFKRSQEDLRIRKNKSPYIDWVDAGGS